MLLCPNKLNFIDILEKKLKRVNGCVALLYSQSRAFVIRMKFYLDDYLDDILFE